MSNLQVNIFGLNFAPIIAEYPIKIVNASPSISNIAEDNNKLKLVDQAGEFNQLFTEQIGAVVEVEDDISSIFTGVISEVTHTSGITTLTIKTDLETNLSAIADIKAFNKSGEYLLSELLGVNFTGDTGELHLYADKEDNILVRELVSAIQKETSLRVYYNDSVKLFAPTFDKPPFEVARVTLTNKAIKKNYKSYDGYSISFLGDGGKPAELSGKIIYSSKLDETSNLQAVDSATSNILGTIKINQGTELYNIELSTDFDYIQIGDWIKFELEKVEKICKVVGYKRQNKKVTVEVIR